jgi:hypothetical protein
MKILLNCLIFITLPVFASIEDIRDQIVLNTYEAQDYQRQSFLNGDKVTSWHYLGMVFAYDDCLEMIEKEIENQRADVKD